MAQESLAPVAAITNLILGIITIELTVFQAIAQQ